MFLQLPRRRLALDAPVVMGILNVTPDSFSDGGVHATLEQACERARQMVAEGAGIIDIGGESTRPGAASVSEAEELDRVVPVIERLARELDVVLSVDTTKPLVMREAIRAGAEMINDINALRAESAVETAAASGAAVCLMHMQGEPRTMQQDPRYQDVVGEVHAFLQERIRHCLAAGIGRERIAVDPGFGFGKRLEHNQALLGRLAAFDDLGCPLLAGLSRKSMFGQLLGLPVERRLPASLAAAVLAAWQGARILRVHDVGPTVEALKVAQFARQAGTPAAPTG
ncbi:dihydropteroate synthase [Solimonas sp. K1W22B-7]|uniref:dihydropteroate synthase n=1 Tax=Solimonas sp. K1W22B-7 TaxID=2303331 RepID=UPI000E32EA9A|nr:dihydropteroate synthase [Solimonas sp. K1W22B-7]AXQ29198.1 dihydropteroate synthase [Solimonas sp. K1W22B-7]